MCAIKRRNGGWRGDTPRLRAFRGQTIDMDCRQCDRHGVYDRKAMVRSSAPALSSWKSAAGLPSAATSTGPIDAKRPFPAYLPQIFWPMGGDVSDDTTRTTPPERESFAPGVSSPCVDGVLDFEQCRDCMNDTDASVTNNKEAFRPLDYPSNGFSLQMHFSTGLWHPLHCK